MSALLHKPSQAEIEWFKKQGNDFVELGDRFTQDGAGVADLLRARETFQSLTGASSIAVGFRESEYLEEMGGIATPESYAKYEAITAVKPVGGNKKRFIFNQVVGSATENGVSYFCRAMPVTWSAAHIGDRNSERNPQQGQIFDQALIPVLGMAVMMAKILQDRAIERPYPILLPAERGVYLGVAQPSHSDLSSNRLQFYAARDIKKLGLGTYEWLPEVRIHVNTYYGPQEMNQSHRQLKAKLASLLHGSLKLGFFYSGDQYMAVEGFDALTEQNDSIYQKAYAGLDRIMNLPSWHNLRLPQRMRNQRRFDY